MGTYVLPCCYTFIACLGFCIVFNIRGLGMVFASAGGALAWLVYLLMGPVTGYHDIMQYFWAAIAISVYSEGMARLRKCPVTGYLCLGFIPLVPGGGIYNTMEYCISGETSRFVEEGIHTLGIAGALAVGVLIVSSLVRMYRRMMHRREVRRVA